MKAPFPVGGPDRRPRPPVSAATPRAAEHPPHEAPATAAPAGSPLSASHVLQLQRSLGNRTVAALLGGRRATLVAAPPPGAAEPAATPGVETGGVIQRLWDVSCKPGKQNQDWIIERVIIEDRPPNPDTSGMAQQGGASFHHESAWNLVERQVLQFEGWTIAAAVNYLATYGLTGSAWPPMTLPANDTMSQLDALNRYFHDFLAGMAAQASGWLGGTGGHSSQGGRISQALRALGRDGFTAQTITRALTQTFEPAPDLQGQALSEAAEAHADAFYAAYQLYLEEGDTVSADQHEEVLEIVRDWTTQYWNENDMEF